MSVSVCQWDRRWDEQINGEGHREVLRVSEGKEGAMRHTDRFTPSPHRASPMYHALSSLHPAAKSHIVQYLMSTLWRGVVHVHLSEGWERHDSQSFIQVN